MRWAAGSAPTAATQEASGGPHSCRGSACSLAQSPGAAGVAPHPQGVRRADRGCLCRRRCPVNGGQRRGAPNAGSPWRADCGRQRRKRGGGRTSPYCHRTDGNRCGHGSHKGGPHYRSNNTLLQKVPHGDGSSSRPAAHSKTGIPWVTAVARGRVVPPAGGLVWSSLRRCRPRREGGAAGAAVAASCRAGQCLSNSSPGARAPRGALPTVWEAPLDRIMVAAQLVQLRLVQAHNKNLEKHIKRV